MVVMHDGGLSSAVALAMASHIGGEDKPTVYHGFEMNGCGAFKLEAATSLCEHYQLDLKTIHMSKITLLKLLKLAADVSLFADKYKHKEIILGIYNKGDIEVASQLLESFKHMVEHTTDGKVTARAPLLSLTYPDLISKAIDFEVPLDLVRDCISSIHKFCGICLPCRHRIAQFKLAGFMDYDYSIDVDWGLSPEDQKEYNSWRGHDDNL